VNALFDQLRAGIDLSAPDVASFCALLLDETQSVEDRAGLLRALSAKGETPAEIACFVRTLLAHAQPLEIAKAGPPVIDVCGTGGDKQGLFNISTAVMFVVAACGARVAKHGNRGVTSKSGGADVLEALGVRIDLEPARAAAVLADVGCVFLFAPVYHPAFKVIAPVRKFLAGCGETSVFNKLGPLLNPANPAFQLAGVFDPAMVDLYGAVFAELGRTRAWAVHGRTPQGGLDEMSTLGPTDVCAMEDGTMRRFCVDAVEQGIPAPDLADLVGGDAAHNALILEALLRGRGPTGITDMVAWNAAGALVVAGLATGITDGLKRAREAIRSGEAAARLDALRAATSSFERSAGI
jgi:anthranilate phosphoribosyltransferase